MGGGHYQEGLPHPHPLPSYWQTPPSDLATHRTTTDIPLTSTYTIIGSGITGASIATKLLSHNPSAQVTVLEARTLCSGATGRNGGHCGTNVGTRFASDVQEYGVEDAIRAEVFEEDCVRNVAAFIRGNGIDCDLDEVERVDFEVEQEGFDATLEVLKMKERAHAEAGMPYARVPTTNDDGRQRETISGFRVYRGKEAADHLKVANVAGAVSRTGYTMSPYKLVTEMFRRLLRQGVNLQTTTPVLSISRNLADEGTRVAGSPFRWTVHTPRGSIDTDHVILATNAYTSALFPILGSTHFLIPTRAQAIAMRPGSAVAGEPRIHKGLGLNGYGQGDYMIQRPTGSSGAGDLIYGGGRRISKTGEHWTLDDSVLHPEIAAYLPKAAQHFYGKHNWGDNGKLIMAWTGIMGYTLDQRPMIGEAKGDPRGEGDGLWICAGFNGHGMALAFQSAQALVDMITTGKEPEYLPESFRLDRVRKYFSQQ